MDPLNVIVTAVVTGAALGLRPMAEQAVKDAYAGLKQLIIARYGDKADVTKAVEEVESNQKAEWPKEMLRDKLDAAGAAEDEEVVEAAQTVLEKADPEGAEAGRYQVAVTASDDSLAVGGGVGGSITTIHGNGNVVGDQSESHVSKS